MPFFVISAIIAVVFWLITVLAARYLGVQIMEIFYGTNEFDGNEKAAFYVGLISAVCGLLTSAVTVLAFFIWLIKVA